MKKYLIILGVISSILAATVSCNEDELDVPPTIFTEGNFLTNQEEFDRGIIGVYQKLLYFYGFNGQDYVAAMRLLPSDDLTTINANPFDIFSGINAADGVIQDYYRYAYQLVSRANTLLFEIEQAEAEAYENQDLRQWHRGEALFLRGYTFFRLWNYFGNAAPVVTERILDLNALQDYPSAQNDEMLDQAIADLTAAAALLPDSWDEGNVGRATRGAALGMAGKAYLFRATVTGDENDYQEALDQFNEIAGYSLVLPYRDNFSPETENNAESLFEIQFGANDVINNPWVGGGNDDFAVIGDLGGYWRFFEANFSIQGGVSGRYIPTSPVLAAYNPEDPRYQYSIFSEDSSVAKYIRDSPINFAVVSYNNARVLRYADVLLMQAEALVQSGGATTEAIELINQVRERARNSADSVVALVPADYPTTETDRDVIMRWVMEERRQELAFEEWHRWFDLRRWHLGGLIDLTEWDFGTASGGFEFMENNLYFPIPATEIELNPNLTQNVGY